MTDLKPVSLPELMAYARENGVEMDAAYEHFRSIGRVGTPPERRPIPDGYQLPPHTFRLTAGAEQRADRLHSRKAVLVQAEEAFQEVMLDIVRGGGTGAWPSFLFNSFAMPDDDYENGYTIVPVDDSVISIEASEFQTITLDDENKTEVQLPTLVE